MVLAQLHGEDLRNIECLAVEMFRSYGVLSCINWSKKCLMSSICA